jgi:hypothetical protein
VYVLGNMRKRKMEETTKDPFLVIMKKMKILIERRRIRNINSIIAKMTSNMAITKIESMTENYPEFLVANLNYAGHQI